MLLRVAGCPCHRSPPPTAGRLRGTGRGEKSIATFGRRLRLGRVNEGGRRCGCTPPPRHDQTSPDLLGEHERARRRVHGVPAGAAAEPAAHRLPADRRPPPGRGRAADLPRQALPGLGQGQRPRLRRRLRPPDHGQREQLAVAQAVEEARARDRGDPGRRPTHDEYDDGRSAALWDVVQSLPPKARAVVVLRYYEQLSEAETADVLGISVGTVKSQCSRAIAALRDRVPADLHPGRRRTPDERHRRHRPQQRRAWEREMSERVRPPRPRPPRGPADLDNVKGKAVNIRRKRRAAVAGGILAAAAVIVPVAVLAERPAGDGRRRRPGPDAVAGRRRPRPTTPRRPEPTPAPEAARLTVERHGAHLPPRRRHQRRAAAERRPRPGRHARRPGRRLRTGDRTSGSST